MSEAGLKPAGGERWALDGVLDFSSVPAIWSVMERLLKAGGGLTVSLANVRQTNSAGLVLLVEARDVARRYRCKLRLIDVPQELLDLARMSGCEALITNNPA